MIDSSLIRNLPVHLLSGYYCFGVSRGGDRKRLSQTCRCRSVGLLWWCGSKGSVPWLYVLLVSCFVGRSSSCVGHFIYVMLSVALFCIPSIMTTFSLVRFRSFGFVFCVLFWRCRCLKCGLELITQILPTFVRKEIRSAPRLLAPCSLVPSRRLFWHRHHRPSLCEAYEASDRAQCHVVGKERAT